MRPLGVVRTVLSLAVVAVLLGMIPAGAQAQETARIQGTVQDADGGEPLAGAQILIEGTGIGTVTNDQGRFMLLNVPAGDATVRVSMLGYANETRTVDVIGGGTATVDFSLSASAVALDEIVVTGQGGEVARREIGTDLTTIDTENLEAAPVSSFSDLMQGRSPGVNLLPGGGKVGQGTKLVLRGPTTFSQGVQPVIYVDGVRIDNSSDDGGIFTGGTTWSGLDDINPADIERIEVVKGASAATLYGTEASAGVIQIFTKQGDQGESTWNYRGEAGLSNSPKDWWDVSVYSDWFHENFVRRGFQQEHQLSTSGGQEGFSYYASGTYRDQTGTLPNNGEDYYAFRGNLQLFPREDLVLRLNTGYSQRRVQMPQDANNIYGYGINALTGGESGNFMAPADIGLIEVFLDANRYTGGITAEYTPLENFTHRLNVGADVYNADDTELHPYGANSFNPRGRKVNYRREATSLTLEYHSQFSASLAEWLTTRTSAGFQGYHKFTHESQASGWDFPAPGLSTVGAAANSTGWEYELTEKTVGFFVQERLGFSNRFFLTVGTRADAHSAFGEDYPYQIYPKVSGSYVVSDHAFWPDDVIGSLRLRASYGTAGRQPGAFDAVRMWNATSGAEGEPAVTPDNLGNADLAPEVSREFEAGVDASALDDRLGLKFTYYRQRTGDALLERRYPPSEGFLDQQFENRGEIMNEGIETSLDATLVETPDVRWNAGVNLSLNRNEILDLGGVPELYVQWTQANRAGYPAGAFFGDRYVMRDGEAVAVEDTPFLLDENGDRRLDENGDPIPNPDNPGYIGPAFPTRTAQLSTDVTIGDRLNIRALLDHAGGHYVESSTVRWLTRLKVPEGDPVRPDKVGESVASWCQSPSDPTIEAMCDNPWPGGGRGNVVMPADYVKLREITVSYTLPDDLVAGLGFGNASAYVSGRNLWRHQETLSLEAEANYDTADDMAQQEYFVTPIPQQFTAGIRLGF